MRWGMIAGAVAMAFAGAALAQAPLETEPDWLKKPTVDDLISVWPPKADRSGEAAISCIVNVKGGLRDCQIKRESPEGLGYGASALLLAPMFQMRPATRDGVPVESSVTIPINFNCPDGCVFSMYGLRRVRRTANWAEAPSFDDVIAAYPKRAAAAKMAADASVSCAVLADGRLGRCRVLTRNPPNKGFETAATRLADKFKGPEGIKPGSPTDPVATRIRFAFDPAILDGDREVDSVGWAQYPSAEEIAAAFPAAARSHKIASGSAQLRCAVKAGGALDGCAVRGESPAGEGFGAAALILAAKARAATWTEDGRPVIGGFVTLPIAFGPATPTR